MAPVMRNTRRLLAAFVVAVVAFCPLAGACLAHASLHGGTVSPSAAADHDHSHHADHSAPVKASVPDGCNAIQHCAPFAWSGDVQSTASVFDFAAVQFPPPAASFAVGMDYDPAVPPPRPLS